MLVPPLCLLIRPAVVQAAGPGRWTAVVVTVLLLYFVVVAGFMVLALRDPRGLVAQAGDERPGPQPAPAPRREESRAA